MGQKNLVKKSLKGLYSCKRSLQPFRELFKIPTKVLFKGPFWLSWIPVLWNRNCFLRFRFRLLKSYSSGSGSDFCHITVAIPVPIPRKQFSKKILEKILPFYILSFFTRKKLISFIKFNVKSEWKNVKCRKSNTQFYTVCLWEHFWYVPFYYGSGTVINCGSGSSFWQVTVTVPQGKKLQFRFPFHNTAGSGDPIQWFLWWTDFIQIFSSSGILYIVQCICVHRVR